MNAFAAAHAPSAAAHLKQRSQKRGSSSNASLHRSATTTPTAAISLSTTTRAVPAAACASASASSAPRRLLSSPASRATAALRNNASSAALLLPLRRSRKTSSRSLAPRASSGDDDRSDAPLERALAAAPYLFPLLDGLRYGRFLFRQYPITQAIVSPLAPLAQLYYTVPFASLVLFFAIYLGLVQQTDRWSRFVRFNAMQAILLDILLILPGVIESVFKAPGGGPGLQIYISMYNTVWLFCLATFVAGVFGALVLGKTVRLPLVAEAADQQVRY